MSGQAFLQAIQKTLLDDDLDRGPPPLERAQHVSQQGRADQRRQTNADERMLGPAGRFGDGPQTLDGIEHILKQRKGLLAQGSQIHAARGSHEERSAEFVLKLAHGDGEAGLADVTGVRSGAKRLLACHGKSKLNLCQGHRLILHLY